MWLRLRLVFSAVSFHPGIAQFLGLFPGLWSWMFPEAESQQVEVTLPTRHTGQAACILRSPRFLRLLPVGQDRSKG